MGKATIENEGNLHREQELWLKKILYTIFRTSKSLELTAIELYDSKCTTGLFN